MKNVTFLCVDYGSDPVSSTGFHAVAFSYGNSNVSTETKDNDTKSSFDPKFPVPESLLNNLVSDLCLNIYFKLCGFPMLLI